MVVTEIRFCPGCGRGRDPAAAFCAGCGRAADAAPAAWSAAPTRPPWWARRVSTKTSLLVLTPPILALVASVAAMVPFEWSAPCTPAQQRIVGALTARVEGTCVRRWPDGLIGPSTVELRDPRVSVGIGGH